MHNGISNDTQPSNSLFHFRSRYGRLKILIIGLMANSVLGIAKAFATDYYAFLTVS